MTPYLFFRSVTQSQYFFNSNSKLVISNDTGHNLFFFFFFKKKKKKKKKKFNESCFYDGTGKALTERPKKYILTKFPHHFEPKCDLSPNDPIFFQFFSRPIVIPL